MGLIEDGNSPPAMIRALGYSVNSMLASYANRNPCDSQVYEASRVGACYKLI